jgi:hypothetical protein
MELIRQAHFSDDGRHRFWLLRSWEEKPHMILFIGLNPSTADAADDDNTIRSCIRITKSNGFGGFVMCNLYTFITAYPTTLIQNLSDANRPESDETLDRMIRNTHLAVCTWGNWHFVADRVAVVTKKIIQPFCLGVNGGGSPKHPLYLSSETQIIPYTI